MAAINIRIVACSVIAVFFSEVATACICSCPPMPQTREELQAEATRILANSDAAFSGIVVGLDTEDQVQELTNDRTGERSQIKLPLRRVTVSPLEVAKGSFTGNISVYDGGVCQPTRVIGQYVGVLAATRDGRLVDIDAQCGCSSRIIFAMDGPLPPWRYFGIATAGVVALGAIAGVFVFYIRGRKTKITVE